jgi:hypothetical protein
MLGPQPQLASPRTSSVQASPYSHSNTMGLLLSMHAALARELHTEALVVAAQTHSAQGFNWLARDD